MNRHEPLFSQDSVTRRVNRETVLLLGGPRALLMQLAHPLVAQGIADHSRFLEDPLGRLRATLDAMLGMVFGDRAAADRIAARVRERHEQVQGVLSTGTARLAPGTPYDARDPHLMLWVHATLVDSALEVYAETLAPLTTAERGAYYEESKRIALLLGVPEWVLPETVSDFEAYMRDMLEGPVLEVTPVARRLADAVLHPPLRFLPRWVGDFGGVLTSGLLPPTLRARYGFHWSPGRERTFRGILRMTRLALPVLPRVVRDMPQARCRSERPGLVIPSTP